MTKKAIDIGAKYRFTENSDYHGIFRVTNIYIDEDNNPQITVEYDENVDVSNKSELLALEDIRNAEKNNEIERTNTPHEAWAYRNS